jgi:hypothetical protein
MQAKHGSAPFADPTGGKITDALNIAKDKVENEGLPADKALKEAKVIAQKELIKFWEASKQCNGCLDLHQVIAISRNMSKKALIWRKRQNDCQ